MAEAEAAEAAAALAMPAAVAAVAVPAVAAAMAAGSANCRLASRNYSAGQQPGAAALAGLLAGRALRLLQLALHVYCLSAASAEQTVCAQQTPTNRRASWPWVAFFRRKLVTCAHGREDGIFAYVRFLPLLGAREPVEQLHVLKPGSMC